MGCQSHGSDSSFRIPILGSTDSPIFSEKSSECDGCEPMDIQQNQPYQLLIPHSVDFGIMAEQALTFEGFLDEQ